MFRKVNKITENIKGKLIRQGFLEMKYHSVNNQVILNKVKLSRKK